MQRTDARTAKRHPLTCVASPQVKTGTGSKICWKFVKSRVRKSSFSSSHTGLDLLLALLKLPSISDLYGTKAFVLEPSKSSKSMPRISSHQSRELEEWKRANTIAFAPSPPTFSLSLRLPPKREAIIIGVGGGATCVTDRLTQMRFQNENHIR